MSRTWSVSGAVAVSLAALVLGARFTDAQTPSQDAERGIITGIVRDAQDLRVLDAVTVRVAGTALGTTTGPDGRYTISGVTPGVALIEAVRIGYAVARVENVRVTRGGIVTVELLMSANALRLANVITAGVSDPISGSKVPFVVANLTAQDVPVSNLSSGAGILKGKVAGLRVVNQTGPLAGNAVQMRNMVTLQTYSFAVSPLYIVDGVILLNTFSGFTGEIEAQDIESIQVIKGPAAAALYGTRAANGVISITTNRGRDIPTGQTRVIARAEYGYSELGRRPALAKYHPYLMDDQGRFVDQFGTPLPAGQRIIDGDRMQDNPWTGTTYDHLAQVFPRGSTLVSRGSVAHNTLATTWSATAAGAHETGVLRGSTGAEKLDVRFNMDHRVSDRLSLSLGAFVSHQYSDDRFSSPVAPDTGLFRNILRVIPTVDLLAPGTNGLPYVLNPDVFNPGARHPLYTEVINDRWTKRLGLQGNASVAFRISNSVSVSGLLGYQRSDRLVNQYISPGAVLSTIAISQGTIAQNSNMDEGINGDLRLNYLAAWRDLTFRASVRMTATYDQQRALAILGDTLDLPGNRSLTRARFTSANGTTGLPLFRKSRDQIETVAFDYAGRYVVEGLYRTDGSSLFGAHARYRNNYRASGAWLLDEEAWWPVPELTLFKLRFSHGTAGNLPPYTAQYETYTTSGARVVKVQSGNATLEPEHVTEDEAGIDLSINDRIGVELTYAVQHTKNLLDTTDILAFTGFRKRMDNVGTLRGRSYEATIEAQWYTTPTFRWSTNLVVDRQRAKVLHYERNGPCSTALTYDNWRCSDTEIGMMQGPRFVVRPDELTVRVAANQITQFDTNDEGLVVWVGPGGSWQDGKWGSTGFVKTPSGDSTQYRWGLPILKRDSLGVAVTEKYGQALPKFSVGMQNTWYWRGFQLYASLTGQFGSHAYDLTRATYMGINMTAEQDQAGKPDYKKKPLEYYTQANSTTIGGRGKNDNGVAAVPTFYESNSYVKLDEMALTYGLLRIPAAVSRLGVRAAAIGIVGRQVYTWTKYRGFDPEIGGDNGGGGTAAAVDGLAYPRYRTFTLQIGLTF